MKKQTSIFLVILLCILVAVAAGGTSYLVLANAHDQETQSLNDQIDRLETQVAKLQKEAKKVAVTPTPTPTTTAATTTTTDPTANWKTYTNSIYGFSFKYPTNWYIDTKTDDLTADIIVRVSNYPNPSAISKENAKADFQMFYINKLAAGDVIDDADVINSASSKKMTIYNLDNFTQTNSHNLIQKIARFTVKNQNFEFNMATELSQISTQSELTQFDQIVKTLTYLN